MIAARPAAIRLGEWRARPARGLLSRLLRERNARVGLAMAAVIALAVCVGPLLLGASTETLDASEKLLGPSTAHPLGTDQLGRDQLVRLLDGGRRTLLAAWLVLVLGFTIGVAAGVAAGVAGGIIELVVMRIVDVLQALPGLVLALVLVAVIGPGVVALVVALTVTLAPGYTRLARSYVLGMRERPDVLSARMAGVGWVRIGAGHLLVPAAIQVLVVATLDLGLVVGLIAGLSFIGLGVQAPTPEWGAMLSDSRLSMTQAPWLLIAPGLAIMASVWAANLIGEGLQAATDPRSRL